MYTHICMYTKYIRVCMYMYGHRFYDIYLLLPMLKSRIIMHVLKKLIYLTYGTSIL